MTRPDWRSDDGTTMMELVVGMTLMTVFMSMFTTVVFLMNNATSSVSALRSSTDSVNTAFLALDKTVRYASAISSPNTTPTSTGNYYVEFQTTSTGTTVCTQLQLNTTTQQLSRRTWTPTDLTTLTAFRPIASGLVPNPAVAGSPFQFGSPATLGFEQLTVALTSTQKSGSQSSTTASAITFTAVNSSDAYKAAIQTPSDPTTICTGSGRP